MLALTCSEIAWLSLLLLRMVDGGRGRNSEGAAGVDCGADEEVPSEGGAVSLDLAGGESW